jgi:hypothetical protein
MERFMRCWWLVAVVSTMAMAQAGIVSSPIAAAYLLTPADSHGETTSPGEPPLAQKVDKGSVYVKPEKIVRKGKGKTRIVIRAPLLTMEWRLLKCNNGVFQEVSPVATFAENDYLRLAVKTNQTGFLYIINQTEGADGTITYGPKQIFPDSKIMNGQNIMRKDQEIILPSACPPGNDPCGCSYRLNHIAGRENFIVVFSREQLLDLSYNKLSNGLIRQVYMEQLKAEFQARHDRNEIKRTSRPGLIEAGANRYTFWIANYNRRDNENLIEIISFNNAGRRSTN